MVQGVCELITGSLFYIMPRSEWHWGNIKNLAAILCLDMTTVSYSLFVVAYPFSNSVLVLSVLYSNIRDFFSYVHSALQAQQIETFSCTSQYFNFYLYPHVELNVDDHKK